MIYYLSAFIFFYIFLISSQQKNGIEYVYIFVGMIPLILLVVLRGNVGTDTATYLSAFEEYRRSSENIENHEPLFFLLSVALVRAFDSSRIALISVGILITLILLGSSALLERRGLIYGACVVPQFYLDMTMNGVRYGLSFSLVVLATSFLVRGYKRYFWTLAAVAGLAHISGLLLALLLYSTTLSLKRAVVDWRFFSGVIISAIGFIYYFSEYLQIKFLAYELFQSPSEFSGIAPLFVSTAALFAWYFDAPRHERSKTLVFTLFVLALVAFLAARYTYAGLRFQYLILFLIFLSFQYRISAFRIKPQRRTYLLFFAVGLLGLSTQLRNLLEGAGEGDSPSIPYTFFWQISPSRP